MFPSHFLPLDPLVRLVLQLLELASQRSQWLGKLLISMARGEQADVKLNGWVEVHTSDDGRSLALNILEKCSLATQRRRGGGPRPEALGGV